MKKKFLIFFILLYSCNSQRNDIAELVAEWENKTIIFPDKTYFSVLGKDTVPVISTSSQYSIVSYIDSTGGTSCKTRFPNWMTFINLLDSTFHNKIPVYFFLHPNNRKTLLHDLIQFHFDYPVCIDEKDSFNKLNHFPSDMRFQTFLLDKNNKVVAIGNPVYNQNVKELYLKIIRGEKVKSECDKKTFKTEADVDKLSVSLGKFDWEKEQKAIFTICNIGKHPLIINDVSTSCGCTSVDYSKEPIRPGDSISLQVTYKADKPEHFNKTITVYCNTNPSIFNLNIVGDAE